MRCINCYYIIVTPDVINGKPGEPGMIRRREAKPTPPGTSIKSTFRCHRCGAEYEQVTTLLGVVMGDKESTDAEDERRRGWR